jgi:membrane fusion protein
MLLELTTDQDIAALGQAHAVVSQALQAQRERLQDDLSNQTHLSEQEHNALQAKLTLLRTQLMQLRGQRDLQAQQVASNQDLLDRIQPLEAKGYVSVFQIAQQKAALLDAQAQYKTLIRQQLDTQQQIDATQQQLAQLPLDSASKQNETERQLANVTQSLAQNEINHAVVLRAPANGIVSTVLLKLGQQASAGQSLVSILPAGSDLQAQLRVPSRAVGFMVRGNTVVLRYQAFPYQKFGQQYGRIEEISRNALTPTEVSALTGQQSQESLYRVLVTLDSQEVLAYGQPEPVKPGMALDADILMERRRLIEWVFEPLFGLGHRLRGEAAHG